MLLSGWRGVAAPAVRLVCGQAGCGRLSATAERVGHAAGRGRDYRGNSVPCRMAVEERPSGLA